MLGMLNGGGRLNGGGGLNGGGRLIQGLAFHRETCNSLSVATLGVEGMNLSQQSTLLNPELL